MAFNTLCNESYILHRSYAKSPLTVVSGSGVVFNLSSGRQVIDASSGPAVACLGHYRPDVIEAVTNQMSKISYVYSGSRFTSDPCEELATALLQLKPGGLEKAIFVNSGSEATDAALKLATQYWHERGQPGRTNFVARKQSYHGNTLGALSVSGHDTRRELYSHWLSNNVSFVDPCYAYRAKYQGETDESYVDRLKQQLEREFLRLGPNTVAAFVAETMSGTTLGCLPAVPGYFKAVRELCDKYDVLLILDEIMCGMGKTGTMHAWEQEGIRGPDIQMIGKALGGGFVPLSGVLLNGKIFHAIAGGSGSLAHGHTFQAHPTACAAALAVQKAIKREGILENVQKMGNILEAQLRGEIAPLPLVGDVRGRGLFWAVEFVVDKETKQCFPATEMFCDHVVEVALELGLSILGNLGHTGFYQVDHVILSPPYIVKEEEICQMVQLLRKAITIVSEKYMARERVNNVSANI